MINGHFQHLKLFTIRWRTTNTTQGEEIDPENEKCKSKVKWIIKFVNCEFGNDFDLEEIVKLQIIAR